MNYQGNKSKYVKHIMPFIEKLLAHSPEATYYEPFVGGGAMFEKVPHHTKRGSDLKSEIIALHNRLLDPEPLPAWIPEEKYNAVKANPENFPEWERGFVLFMGSFGHSWACSYLGWDERGAPPLGSAGFNRTVPAAGNVAHTQCLYFHDLSLGRELSFEHKPYTEVTPVKGDVLYLDPPYIGTTGYSTGGFDHGQFWAWVQLMEMYGVYVLISEGTSHELCSVLWSTTVTKALQGASGTRGEVLMCLKGGLTERVLFKC